MVWLQGFAQTVASFHSAGEIVFPSQSQGIASREGPALGEMLWELHLQRPLLPRKPSPSHGTCHCGEPTPPKRPRPPGHQDTSTCVSWQESQVMSHHLLLVTHQAQCWVLHAAMHRTRYNICTGRATLLGARDRNSKMGLIPPRCGSSSFKKNIKVKSSPALTCSGRKLNLSHFASFSPTVV